MRTLVVTAAVLWATAIGFGGVAVLSKLPKTPSVTINNGDPVPNMTRPTQLHIQNVTKEECDGMGGKYDAKVVLCKNVDY